MNTLFIFWIVATVLLGIIEMMTADLVCIWFAVGALVATILAYFKMKLIIQIIAFIIVSVISIIITRPLTRKLLRGNIEKTNSDRLIGKQALVTTTIQPDSRGEVKVSGEYWSAISIDNIVIEKGNHVEILAIEGVKLVVKNIK